jgi:ankyrin repeat protein
LFPKALEGDLNSGSFWPIEIQNSLENEMKKRKTILTVLLFTVGLTASLFAAEIHEAVKAGNLAAVQALIEKDPGTINAKDETGRTPLHWAARGTNNEVLSYLAEKGAELNALDNNGTAPLHSLASRGNADGARILLAKGADINIKAPNQSTALHFAALSRRVDMIRLLVEGKADLESRDQQGRTPLVAAAREMAGPGVIRTLLDLGANIESVDKSGATALGLAAWRGSADVVSLLLDRKASFPVNTRDGRELLGFAVSTGLADLFSRMVEKGADLNQEAGNRGTLLHAAAEGGVIPILEILLGKGLNINGADAYGWTPLHFAADMGRTAAVELLLSKGADPKILTGMGQSAYNLAEDNEDKEMTAFLGVKGFDRSPARFPELAGEYLGQKKPGKKAEVFAPGIVSGRFSLHSNVVFSPDGKEAFWSLQIPARTIGYSSGRTVFSRFVDGRWTYPRKAVFSGTELDDVPFFHPAGTHLFDMAPRPFPGGRETGKENIWIWDKDPAGWSNPRPLDAAVNDLPHHWQFSVDREGTVYFSTNIPGSLGQGDIYVARLAGGRYQKPENLGAQINSPAGEGFPFIAPDGRYLLFERNFDIYASFRQKDGTWGAAKRLGPEVNTPGMEILPIVSPDGKYLFFSRNQQSYWIDAAVIEDVRLKDSK